VFLIVAMYAYTSHVACEGEDVIHNKTTVFFKILRDRNALLNFSKGLSKYSRVLRYDRLGETGTAL